MDRDSEEGGETVKIGVTGTREGMTEAQRNALDCLFYSLTVCEEDKMTELHFGDCLGADAEAFALCKEEYPAVRTVCHPPNNDALRAFCKANETRPALHYMDRNREIVEACDLLIVLPKRPYEEQRSGTWATCRIAEKAGKPIKVIWPSGWVKERK